PTADALPSVSRGHGEAHLDGSGPTLGGGGTIHGLRVAGDGIAGDQMQRWVRIRVVEDRDAHRPHGIAIVLSKRSDGIHAYRFLFRPDVGSLADPRRSVSHHLSLSTRVARSISPFLRTEPI